MTWRTYKSSDTSAPTLTGQAGSLTTLLDAVLVNGYGSQTAAGWTINQTATNKRGYKQNLTGSNNSSGMLLYVDDTAPTTAKEARVCGFESMSAITPTGTGQFPTSAQSTIGVGTLAIRKSTTADATVRNWTIIANGQTIYMFFETGDSTAPLACATFIFGDYKSFKATDPYAVGIAGRQLENTGSAQYDPMQAVSIGAGINIVPCNSTMFGHYGARSWTGVGGSLRLARPFDLSLAVAVDNSSILRGPYTGETQTAAPSSTAVAPGRFNSTTNLVLPAPNGADGSILLARVYIGHSFSLRGYYPGLWMPLHDRPLGHNDTFTPSGGDFNGHSMLAQNIQAYINSSANGDNGVMVVETSDPFL